MDVLIADDNRTTRITLEDMVSDWGYTVHLACDGQEALEFLTGASRPLVALIDWVMPGLDGVELCQHLKRGSSTAFVYVIMLTGRTESQDVVEALDAGANDFLRKPVDDDELRSRLAVGARTVQLEQQLMDYGGQMEALAAERAQQLIHADRLATIGTLSASILHEINGPIGAIAMLVELLQQNWQPIDRLVRQAMPSQGSPTDPVVELLADMPEFLGDVDAGLTRVRGIIDGLKAYARKDQGLWQRLDVNVCVSSALRLARADMRRDITIIEDLADEPLWVHGVDQQIEQVLMNLAINARDAMEGQRDARLTIQTRHDGDAVVIAVTDTGPGIPPRHRDDIWQPFFTTKDRHRGTGLGLSLVRGLIEEHRGVIAAEDAPDGGARFVITLPAHSAPTSQVKAISATNPK